MFNPTNHPISLIRVSPNGRYFVDPHGKPFFWSGDTQWELFRRFNSEQARCILKDRQAKGFNVILIMLTGVDAGNVLPDMAAPYANLAGEMPWIDDDPLQPNEAYFRHVDDMIRLGEQTGQVFVVGVYHKWHVQRIPLEKARRWAAWVARRYRDVPNLIWSMYPEAKETYIPVCRELAAGLQEGDGGAHLISVHPDPSVASSSFLHNEPWLAFNMIQTCVDYDQINAAVSADYQRTPAKPVIMAEGAYEGEEFGKVQAAHEIRKQAYWTQLAGGHHVYGHNDAWRFPLKFDDWLGAPGAGQMRVFKEIITSLPEWWNLVPGPAIIASGAGRGYSLNLAARSAAGRWILAYLSEPSSVTIRLESLAASGQGRAHWIEPATGDRQPAGVFAAGSTQPFSSPQGWEDALLLIELEE